MKCPRCQIELRRADYEGQVVYQCRQCTGYLVERSGLALVDFSRSSQIGEQEGFDEDFDPARILRSSEYSRENRSQDQHAAIRCPRCHSQTEFRKLSVESQEVLLDECQLCHAVWFDAGELVTLQKHINASQSAIARLKSSLHSSDRHEQQPVTRETVDDEDLPTRNRRELSDIVSLLGIIVVAGLTLLFKMLATSRRTENVIGTFDLLAGLAFLVVTIIAVATTARFLSRSPQQLIFSILIAIVGTILAVLIWQW